MSQYRKKPVVIEAVRWYGKLTDETEWPDWFRDQLGKGLRLDANTTYPSMTLVIVTLEGDMRASPGDWIIRGVKGELYPCKPDIFEALYEDA
jgi:hypothetical protein